MVSFLGGVEFTITSSWVRREVNGINPNTSILRNAELTLQVCLSFLRYEEGRYNVCWGV
jgi:hypothetical protein